MPGALANTGPEEQTVNKHSPTYAVVQGNPLHGLSLWGPFTTAEDAYQWAERISGDWWVTNIEHPHTYSGVVLARDTLRTLEGTDNE